MSHLNPQRVPRPSAQRRAHEAGVRTRLAGWSVALLGALGLFLGACGDDGGGPSVSTDPCADVSCPLGQQCDSLSGECVSVLTNNGTTGSNSGTNNTSTNNNSTTGTNNSTTTPSCPDDCAAPAAECDGDTAVTYSGAGACQDDGTCDFEAVRSTEACAFGCTSGACNSGAEGSPCGGEDDCRPGFFCDGGACAAGCNDGEDCNDDEICDADTNTCVVGCDDDAFEPNQTREDAADLGATAGGAPVRAEDLTLCVGDVDYYAVEAAELEEFLFAVTLEDGAEPVVTVLAPSGDLADVEETNDGTLVVAQESGTYVLWVEAPDGASAPIFYSLTLALREAGEACSADLFEPNDTLDDASEVELTYNEREDVAGLRLCQGDIDQFTFDAAQGDTFTLTLDEPDVEGPISVRVRNLDTSVDLYDDVLDPVDPLALELDAGEHVVVVTAEGLPETGQGYGLRMLLEPGEVACEDDDFEDNDSQDTAADIAAPGAQGLAMCGDDGADWYSVFVPGGAEVDIALVYAAMGDAGALNLQVYEDGERIEIAGPGDCDGSACEVVDTLIAAGGPTTYVLAVQPVGDVERVVYDIDVAFSGCQPDANEPNGDETSATPFPTDCRLQGSVCPGDADWYVIDTNPGEVFEVSMRFFNSEGDIDLTLYKEVDGGAEFVGFTATTADCESISNADDTSASRYWVVVDAFEAVTENPAYRMVWGASCQEDEPQIDFCE